MPETPPPIQDDLLADWAIAQFLAGYEPLLYAADRGLTPEQVWDQIRWTLRKCIEANRKRARGGRQGGRPQRPFDTLSPRQQARRLAQEQERAQCAYQAGGIVIAETHDGIKRGKVLEASQNRRGDTVLLLEDLDPPSEMYRVFSTNARRCRLIGP